MEFFKSTPVKLTMAIVAEATTTARRVELRDSDTKGLILRVSNTGHKTFACKFRNGGHVITAKLGTPDLLGLKEARALAAETRAKTIRATIRTGARSDRIVTLGQLIIEALPVLSERKKGGAIWNTRKHRTTPDAVSGINSVFETLLDKRAINISVEDLLGCIMGHQNRQISKKGNTKAATAAPGAAGRATSYISTLFDWAANRGEFSKPGSGRPVKVTVQDVSKIYRPQTKGNPRDRHLSSQEAGQFYLLVRHFNGDEGLAAYFFLLITSSRRCEMENADFSQFNLDLGVWWKRVKGGQIVAVGLPSELVSWIQNLPSYRETGGKGPLFRNKKKTGPFVDWSGVANRLHAKMGCPRWTCHDLRRTSTTAIATITSDAFARWELPTHKDPQVPTDAAAEVHKLFYLPQQTDVREHYEPHRSPWIVNNRITRTREMITWLMGFYEMLASKVAAGPLGTAAPANALDTPDVSETNPFLLAS